MIFSSLHAGIAAQKEEDDVKTSCNKNCLAWTGLTTGQLMHGNAGIMEKDNS